MKNITVKVKFNIYGNYCGFVGRNKVTVCGEEWYIKKWIIALLENNSQYKQSEKCYFYGKI